MLLLFMRRRRLKAMRRVAVLDPAGGFLPRRMYGKTQTSRCTTILVTPRSKTYDRGTAGNKMMRRGARAVRTVRIHIQMQMGDTWSAAPLNRYEACRKMADLHVAHQTRSCCITATVPSQGRAFRQAPARRRTSSPERRATPAGGAPVAASSVRTPQPGL